MMFPQLAPEVGDALEGICRLCRALHRFLERLFPAVKLRPKLRIVTPGQNPNRISISELLCHASKFRALSQYQVFKSSKPIF